MDIDSLVQEKIDADAAFQETLANTPEEERAQVIEGKKKEVLSNEFSSLKEKADEAEKAKELANNYKTRAEKAERAAKELSPEQKEDLTTKDVLFLAKTDIHEDDMADVLEWAKFKKVSVSDAYKQLKSTLDVRTEERRTAQATQVRSGARGSSKVSGDEILTKAETTGEVPETDEGMNALFQARMARRFKK